MNNQDDLERYEDIFTLDEDGNITDIDYDRIVSEYIADRNDDILYEFAWDRLRDDILYEVIDRQKQINDNVLFIDGRQVDPKDDNEIGEAISGYYGDAYIYEDEKGNFEDWYTMPKDERQRYILARHMPECRRIIEEEMNQREEDEEKGYDPSDSYYNDDMFAGLEGKDLWLAALEYIIENEEFDDISVYEEYLTPIHKPF